MPFSKLPRESLRALYYKLGGTDDISDLRTRRALLKKIYEAMGNDSADLDNMHRANSVLQKISEVASAGGNGGKYVGVDISDAQPLNSTSPNSVENPMILSSRATSEINAIMDAGKIPIFEANEAGHSGYGIAVYWENGITGWRFKIAFRFLANGGISQRELYCRSSDYTEMPVSPTPGGGTEHNF